jgi:cytochrome P450
VPFLSHFLIHLIIYTYQSTEDDIIPLSVPLHTADNKTTDRISIGSGQLVRIPIRTMNRSAEIWGADSKEFKPQRWLEEGGIQGKAKEIQGYRHLLTFVDGPRMCMGKSFALIEIKVRRVQNLYLG